MGCGSFVVRIRKVLIFSFLRFSKFLSLVSIFRARLSVKLSARVRGNVVRVWFQHFKPSSPIVRELVLSLTRLSFPLVRFRQPPHKLSMEDKMAAGAFEHPRNYG